LRIRPSNAFITRCRPLTRQARPDAQASQLGDGINIVDKVIH
jgi:hypothetical protein